MQFSAPKASISAPPTWGGRAGVAWRESEGEGESEARDAEAWREGEGEG